MELQSTQAVEDEITIDLRELFQALLRKAKWIVAATLLLAVLAGVGTKLFITPQYTASSSIYILSSTTSITSLTDLQIGESLTADFQIIATSRPVIEAVITSLSLDATYAQMLKTIEVTNISGTRILTIAVENPDPQLAADISNALSIALCDRIAELMSTDRPTTVESAIAPEDPTSPNALKNTLIGALLGLALSAGIVIVLYLLDDTIKDAEDIAKYLHLTTLAEIPVEPTEGEAETGYATKYLLQRGIARKQKEDSYDFFNM